MFRIPDCRSVLGEQVISMARLIRQVQRGAQTDGRCRVESRHKGQPVPRYRKLCVCRSKKARQTSMLRPVLSDGRVMFREKSGLATDIWEEIGDGV